MERAWREGGRAQGKVVLESAISTTHCAQSSFSYKLNNKTAKGHLDKKSKTEDPS